MDNIVMEDALVIHGECKGEVNPNSSFAQELRDLMLRHCVYKIDVILVPKFKTVQQRQIDAVLAESQKEKNKKIEEN